MIAWIITLVLSVFIIFINHANDYDPSTGLYIFGVLGIIFGIIGCISTWKKNDDESKNGSKVIKGVVISIILIGLMYLGVSCFVSLQDDTTFHYLDTNGNDQADPDEYRWTEDGEGNETPGW